MFKGLTKQTGRLINIEGPDGSGKSTLARSFAEKITREGFEVVATRQPGGSPRGEEIRALMLRREPSEQFSDMALLTLFYADRYQHLHDVIIPSLEAGKVVICDRSELSTFAYQVHAPDKYDLLDLFLSQHAFVTKLLNRYDCRTFVCNLSVEEADYRLEARAKEKGEINVFDKMPHEFKARVHEGMQKGQQYLRDTYVFHTIDAMQNPAEMLTQTCEHFCG